MPDTASNEPVTETGYGNFEQEFEPEQLRWNFFWFSTFFALNHGMVTTPLVVATSVLPQSAANSGNSLLYAFTCLSSLFIGAGVVSAAGIKYSIIISMMLYCGYVGLFATALKTGMLSVEAQTFIFDIGSIAGGTAAGLLWTAQGTYFTRTVDLISQKEGGSRANLTNELSSKFASLYLGFEVVCKLTWSMLDYLSVPVWKTAGSFFVVGLFSVVAMTKVENLSLHGVQPGVLDKAKATFALWRDPIVFLIAGINVTFGFSAAVMNGYVNATFTKPQLKGAAVPMLAAFTCVVAAVLSRAFGELGRYGKGIMIGIGSACFFMIPFLILAVDCCNGWGWWLISLYALQGAGRAVYESTSKGVFADMFPDNSVGAFANCMLQSSLSFSFCFFLSQRLAPNVAGRELAVISMALSALTPIGYALAVHLKASRALQSTGVLITQRDAT